MVNIFLQFFCVDQGIKGFHTVNNFLHCLKFKIFLTKF